MRKIKRNNYGATPSADGTIRTANSSTKKAWLTVVLVIILCVLSYVVAVSQEIPTIRGGGGSISKTDDALKLYRFYTKMNTAAKKLPDSMDEAIYTVDPRTKERSLVFFYRFGQTNHAYPIKDNPNQTVRYLDGWIITPDLCLHDIGSYQLESYDDENEQLGYQWECRWDEQDCTLRPSYRVLFPLAARVRIWQESHNINPVIMLGSLCFLDFAVVVGVTILYVFIPLARKYLIH